VLAVTLPIGALGPGTMQGGSVGTVTYTDTSGDGTVTLATIGPSFCQALVNGALSQGLGAFNDTAFGGPGAFGTIGQMTWGTPIPSQPFGPVSAGSMEIELTFSLTAGDNVDIPMSFAVKSGPAPVPEPPRSHCSA